MKSERIHNLQPGFSILELLFALTLTLTATGISVSIIASSFHLRGRENKRTEALADMRRALNGMTREIANAGFSLSNNGIVNSDSSETTIRLRSNLNALDEETTSSMVADENEDVLFKVHTENGQKYIIRSDLNLGARSTVLANRVDALVFRYFSEKVDYTESNCDISTTAAEVTNKAAAKFIVITVCVMLPAQGTAGSSGYQPESRIQLTSDVMLRNADLYNY